MEDLTEIILAAFERQTPSADYITLSSWLQKYEHLKEFNDIYDLFAQLENISVCSAIEFTVKTLLSLKH